MASITQALRTAQSGLLVNQQTLNVVANNIANVNTIGYSRKIVAAESQVIAGVGVGVTATTVGVGVGVGVTATTVGVGIGVWGGDRLAYFTEWGTLYQPRCTLRL